MQSPVVSIILPTNGEIVPANGDITYDPGTSVTVTCTLDLVAVACDIHGTYPYTGLTDGPHTFTVQGVNSIGEVSNIATVTFIVDSTPPGIAFTTPPTPTEGATVGQSPSFQFHVSPAEPPTTTYLCNYDALAPFACALNTPYVPFPAFSAGPHSFTVVGTDLAGNHATIVRHVIVDHSPPILVFVTPPTPTEGEIVGPTPHWQFHAVSQEPATTIYVCQFDSDTSFVSGCTPDVPLVHTTPFPTGPHQLQVTGTDVAGNHATIVRHVIVDATPPGIAFTRPPTPTEGATVSPTPTFQFHVSPAEPASTIYTCHFDSEANLLSGCLLDTPIQHATPLSPGGHTFTVVATDIFGNQATIFVDVIVASLTPLPNVSCQPDDSSGEADCTFVVTNPTGDVTCACLVDGAAPPDGSGSDCTPSFTCSDGSCSGTTTVTWEQLSPWFHQVSISCTSGGGTPGGAGTVLPIANGDGHVVLIGSNFAPQPTGPSGELEPAPANQLFVNAVTTLTAADGDFNEVNGFLRPINVLGVVIPNADSTMTVDPIEKEDALSSPRLPLQHRPAVDAPLVHRDRRPHRADPRGQPRRQGRGHHLRSAQPDAGCHGDRSVAGRSPRLHQRRRRGDPAGRRDADRDLLQRRAQDLHDDRPGRRAHRLLAQCSPPPGRERPLRAADASLTP